MANKPPITVLGAVTQDAHLDISGPALHHGEFCLPDKEKIIAKQSLRTYGGGGLNVAVGMARLKFPVSFVAAVGDDVVGREALAFLKKEGMKVKLIVKKEVPTALTFVLRRGNHERLLEDRGASNLLQWRDVVSEARQAKNLVLSHLSGKADKIVSKLPSVISTKSTVIWAPGTLQIENGFKKYSAMLKRSSLLFINDNELPLFMGTKSLDLNTLADALLGAGLQRLVVTKSARGATVYWQEDSVTKRKAITAKKVKIVDHVGAGDAFVSGFISRFLLNNDMQDSLKAGTVNAASVLQASGTTAGLLSDAELRKVA